MNDMSNERIKESKLFMLLSKSEQKKQGTSAPVLRQIEGVTCKQRLKAYRRTIEFHIHAKLDNNPYVLQKLLGKQNPNAKDETGRTALHYACRHGAIATVHTLVTGEATIDEPDANMRWTPLHFAAMGGHEEIVAILLENAPVQCVTINRKDKNGTTPLMLACGEDHAKVAKMLLRNKAFADETDNNGWSALHYVAATDAAVALEVLLKYDANYKARTYGTNETALEMAVRLRSHLVSIMLQEYINKDRERLTQDHNM